MIYNIPTLFAVACMAERADKTARQKYNGCVSDDYGEYDIQLFNSYNRMKIKILKGIK